MHCANITLTGVFTTTTTLSVVMHPFLPKTRIKSCPSQNTTFFYLNRQTNRILITIIIIQSIYISEHENERELKMKQKCDIIHAFLHVQTIILYICSSFLVPGYNVHDTFCEMYPNMAAYRWKLVVFPNATLQLLLLLPEHAKTQRGKDFCLNS